jgi:hypothetical protein
MVGGGGSVDEAASRFGLPADILGEAEQFRQSDGIYPDNAQIVEIFSCMMTQWRIGPNGKPSGLDYKALETPMRIKRVKPEDEEDVFDGLRVMELAALKTMREK